jgi:hypothetical protein
MELHEERVQPAAVENRPVGACECETTVHTFGIEALHVEEQNTHPNGKPERHLEEPSNTVQS